MSKGCCVALVFIFLALVYLYQIVVLALVLPINVDCSNNSNIPADPAVNLSMQNWILGGMIAGIVIISFTCASSRSSSNSDGFAGFIALLYILYNLFTFIWSIIGIVMYNDYYGEACKNSDNYATLMNLGFYTGLICSAIMIVSMCLGCCIICKEAVAKGREEGEKLIDDDVNNVVARQDQEEGLGQRKEKIRSIQDQGRAGPMTDAEEQRQRTLFGNIYNRIVGDRQIQ